MSRWLPIGAFIVVATGCLAAGCGRGSEDGAPVQRGESRAGQAMGSNGAPKPVRRLASVGFQDDQFFKLIEIGVRDAAAKAGVEVMVANSNSAPDKEIELVDTYITRKVDAILIAPLSRTSSIPALRRAHESGIKIVTFDSEIDADFPVSRIRSDQRALGAGTGRVAADYIRSKLGGKAKLAILSYVSFLPEAANQRNKGFLDEVRRLPGVELVAQQDAWIAERATEKVEQMLAAHPEINVIWAANEGGTVGAVTGVKAAGRTGKVVVFGTDMSEQIAGFLLASDGILQAVTGQKPAEIGAAAVNTALAALDGKKVEPVQELPGLTFERSNPDAVRRYREHLKSLSQ